MNYFLRTTMVQGELRYRVVNIKQGFVAEFVFEKDAKKFLDWKNAE